MIFQKARRVIAFVVLVGKASAVSGQKSNPIAGFQPRTNVDDFLEKDLIQKNFVDIMEDEECDSFADGEVYYRFSNGRYFQTIPTYGNGKDETIADEYEDYRRYYGDDSFHLAWVDAAFGKNNTNFQRGNANFGKAFPKNTEGSGECIGFEESVKMATGYVFRFIESIQLLQKAIDSAASGCIAQIRGNGFTYSESCLDAITAWDAAAAIYVGSLEGEDGKEVAGGMRSYGNSFYSLADRRCRNYKNCGPDKSSPDRLLVSPVNTQILSFFASGSQASFSGDTTRMIRYKRLISNKMAVPLIQGTLRYAWRMTGNGKANENDDKFFASDEDVSEAGTFAFGVLPKVFACSEKGAKVIENQLKIGGGVAGRIPVDFESIRLAFECNYKCLGITCSEVGSLFDGDEYPRFPSYNDEENGSQHKCGVRNKQRKQKCKLFTGRPGSARKENLASLSFPF